MVGSLRASLEVLLRDATPVRHESNNRKLAPRNAKVAPMRVSYGNGGWVQVDGIGLPGPLYVRFAPDERGRWRAVEIYVDGDGTPLSTAVLRQVRLDLLEAAVGQYENMAARSATPGPDLHRLAAHYATTWGRSAYAGEHCDTCGGPIRGIRGRILALRNWVAESWFAQFPDSGIRQVPLPRESTSLDAEFEELPEIEPPAGRRMTDDFLETIARAYAIAALKGLRPAPAIASKAGVSPRTVHKWIYTARARGFMPPGTRGRVG
jgi:hypothetical protein